MIAPQTPEKENCMPPLSRPRRRRWLLMNESPTGNLVAESTDAVAAPAPSVPGKTAGTMRNQFLDDCGVPEGFDVQVTVGGHPDVHSVHVDEPFAFIGRDEECGVRLPGPEIGRHHAYLQAVGGQFIVVDLGSRTGIRQNGRAVRTALLSAGESVEIGPYTVRVTCEAGADFHELPTEAETQRCNPPIALAFVNQTKPIPPWTVDTPVTLIGSAKPSRIRLEHSSVSPQHCAIIRGFTNWWVVDLNSQSGTLVDHQPVSYRALLAGSKLQIGRYQIDIRKPKASEAVIQPPVFDEVAVQAHSHVSLMPTTPTMPMASATAGGPGGASEQLVIELFREFAALHERTVSQLQQSFREMLDVATSSNRPAIAAALGQEAVAAPQPVPVQQPIIQQPVVQQAAVEEPFVESESEESSLSDLMQSDDPEERAAAQELLAAQMRTLEAKLKGEREGIAKRLMRSLSLMK
jgi:pSer/pThr/pTyr-binding forkhead associated (FHA) protein